MKRTALRSRYRPVPAPLRDMVFERDGYACLSCGSTASLVVNHRYGGHGRPGRVCDLVTACWWCNDLYESDADLRAIADARGIRLRRHQSASTPVVDWAGRAWLLHPDGTRTELEAS